MSLRSKSEILRRELPPIAKLAWPLALALILIGAILAFVWRRKAAAWAVASPPGRVVAE